MLDKFLALLERFVVAHELIAKTHAERGVLIEGGNIAALVAVSEKDKAEGKTMSKDELLADKPKTKAKPVEDDLANDDEPEGKPRARKPRATKQKAEPEQNLDKLREEIEVMAKHIGSGDSDECADEMEDLLDEYEARSVKKLNDTQVPEFHKELKNIVAKYYDIEE